MLPAEQQEGMQRAHRMFCFLTKLKLLSGECRHGQSKYVFCEIRVPNTPKKKKKDLQLQNTLHPGHWPISKQELIMKFWKPFITFIESIDFDLL